MDDIPTVIYWMDKPITELTREELLEVVKWSAQEIERLRRIPKDYRAMIYQKLTSKGNPPQ